MKIHKGCTVITEGRTLKPNNMMEEKVQSYIHLDPRLHSYEVNEERLGMATRKPYAEKVEIFGNSINLDDQIQKLKHHHHHHYVAATSIGSASLTLIVLIVCVFLCRRQQRQSKTTTIVIDKAKSSTDTPNGTSAPVPGPSKKPFASVRWKRNTSSNDSTDNI